jgi:phosphoserine phosphatase RsbU/P
MMEETGTGPQSQPDCWTPESEIISIPYNGGSEPDANIFRLANLCIVGRAPMTQSLSDQRWQLTALAVGVVLLSASLIGAALFLFRRKTGDRNLLFFAVFSLLYAVRLIFRQSFFQLLVPAPSHFWIYAESIIDNFIVVPLTLFLIETVQQRWKKILNLLLMFQIAFGTVRFLSTMSNVGRRPVETIDHIVIVAYCTLLLLYPFSFKRGERLPREFKVAYAGLLVFALFVVENNLADLGVFRSHGAEPIGFLVLVCCLGYVAASRTYSNEQRLLSIQKELEIARQIQSSILPRELPRVAFLDIAALYVPMAAVAGDFYDFILIDEKRIGILIADVTGHGVPAALIASMLKVALAAQAAVAHDPAKVLEGLNNSLCGKFEAHFVTAGYVFLDAEEHLLRYAGAGHPPLLLGSLDTNKQAVFHEIESNGLMLGLFEGAKYSSLEVPFRPGDRCLLYTDGVLEGKNAAQEEFGVSRFRTFLEAQPNLTAAPLINALLSELARWSGRTSGGGQEDDVTLIAVDFQHA